MSNLWAACGCGPRAKVFAVKYPRYQQLVLILIILYLTFLLEMDLSATLSRLLPLQLGFERFQHKL